MKALVDFHIHSVNSDGRSTAEDILAMLKERGVIHAAITDHDFVTTVSKDSEVNLMLACELTCSYDKHIVHILAYGNKHNKSVIDMCDENNKRKRNACIGLMYSRYKQRCCITNRKEAFLGSDVSTNKITDLELSAFTSNLITAQDAIEGINKVGWISVLAHPFRGMAHMDDCIKTIIELKKMGLSGIECYNPNIPEEISRYLLKFAMKEGLLVSGGSDFHGSKNLKEQIGVSIEEEYVRQFLQAFKK